MAEADVEPVFKTKRQRLVRDVLLVLGFGLAFWSFFLQEPPGLYGGTYFVSGGILGSLAVVVRASDLFRWPDWFPWSTVANAGLAVALLLGLRFAESETAWTGVGVAAGFLTARLSMYATGAWRPGDLP